MATTVSNETVEHNRAASRRWIEVFNERDDAGEADVRGHDYVAYAPASLEPAPLLKRLADEGKTFASLAAASKAA